MAFRSFCAFYTFGLLLFLIPAVDLRSIDSKYSDSDMRQHDEAEYRASTTRPVSEEYDDDDGDGDGEDVGDWPDVDDVTTSAPVIMMAALKLPPQIGKPKKPVLPVREKPLIHISPNLTDTKHKPGKNESKKLQPTVVVELVTESKREKYTKRPPTVATTPVAVHSNPSTSQTVAVSGRTTNAPSTEKRVEKKGRKTTVSPATRRTGSTSTTEITTATLALRTTAVPANPVTESGHGSKLGKPTVTPRPTTPPPTTRYVLPPSKTPEPITPETKVELEIETTEKPKHIANIAWEVDDNAHQAQLTEPNRPQHPIVPAITPATKFNKSIDEKKKENEILKTNSAIVGFVPLPTSSSSPTIYIRLELTMTWDEVCQLLVEFRSTVALVFHESTLGIDVSSNQVHVMSESLFCIADRQKRDIIDRNLRRLGGGPRMRRSTRTILLEFYMVRTTGQFTATLTKLCAGIMDQAHDRLQQLFKGQYLGFGVLDYSALNPVAVISKGMEPGAIIAMVLAPLAAVGLILLLVIQILQVRRRQLEKPLPRFPGTGSTSHSADSVSLATVLAGAYPLTYYNEGMEMEVAEPSRSTIFPGVNNYRLDTEALDDEFKRLPNYMPRLSEVPRGAETKNRYANVVPLPETRVPLEFRLAEKNSEYINANYVKGFQNRCIEYIATQAPLPSTIPDFWRMVWEHQCKVVVMLDSPSELQQNKYSQYFPCEETGSMCLYGDYQILLKYREERTDYTLSTLELKYMERNLCREIQHFWFTGWPSRGVPDQARNVVRFLMDLQPYKDPRLNDAPCVVHCSPGTGRTGTILAIDIGMKSIVKDHCADIVNIVYHLRRQRAGAVQTRDQYAFIHMALNEYTSIVRRTPVIRPNTSIGSSMDALDSSAC